MFAVFAGGRLFARRPALSGGYTRRQASRGGVHQWVFATSYSRARHPSAPPYQNCRQNRHHARRKSAIRNLT